MKHVMVMQGIELETVRKGYGHNISKLWNAAEMSDLREVAGRNAESAIDKAKGKGCYTDDFSKLDPNNCLEKAINDLRRLHTNESDYALRYVAQPGESVPSPLFLLDTLQPTKNEFARRYSRSKGQQYNG